MNTEPLRNQIKRNPIRAKTTHLLLRGPNFVSGSGDPEASPAPLACEASALTAELTARNRSILVTKSSFVNMYLPTVADAPVYPSEVATLQRQ